MIVCDLCLSEIKPKDKTSKIRIHTHYACKAWQEAEIDICEKCRKELQEKINQTEAEFYQKKQFESKELLKNE